MGKSRLVDALVAEALAEGARAWLSEGVVYAAEAPYTPWIQLIQSTAGITAGDAVEVRSRKVQERLLNLGLEEAEVTGPLLELLGLPAASVLREDRHPDARPAAHSPVPDRPSLFERVEKQAARPAEGGLNLWALTGKRQVASTQAIWQRLEARVMAREQARLFAALDAFLQRLAAESPVLLLLENVQWLDATSRELLAYLAERLGERAVLVLLLQRTGEEGEGAQNQPVSIRDSEVLLLEPLPQQDTGAMLEQLLGELPPGTDRTALAETIYEQSGGNPLFVEEMARLLLQAGVGQPGSSAGNLTAALRGSGTLRELVLGRLDGRPPAERDVVRAASVVGDDFYARDLPPLLESDGGELPLAESLAGLCEAQLTQILEAGVDPHYAFHHGLVREMIYSSLSFGRRRTLHAQVAASLEKRVAYDPTMAGQGLAMYAELLAHHYQRARQSFAAAFYLILSGHKARQRYAYTQAAGAYRRAIATLEQISPEQTGVEERIVKAQAYEGVGDMALLSGDPAGAETAYGTADAVLSEGNVVEYDWPRLLLKQALVLPTQGRAEEAIAHAGEAWAALEAGPDPAPAQLLEAAVILAWLLWREGDVAAGEWLALAEQLAGEDGGRWHTGVVALLADLRGDWAAAQQLYQEADRPACAALAICRQGDAQLEQGEIATALALYEQAAKRWQQEGDAMGLALARYRQAEARHRQGEEAVAGRLLHEALELLEGAAPLAPVGQSEPESSRAAPRPGLRDRANGAPEDRETVEQALKCLEGETAHEWPAWRGQRYEDMRRILVLYRF